MIEPWKPPSSEPDQRSWIGQFDARVDFWSPPRRDIPRWAQGSNKPMAKRVVEVFQEGLDPAGIRRSFDHDPELAISAAIIWGYRKSPRRMGRFLGLGGRDDLSALAARVVALRKGRTEAKHIVSRLKFPGLGISTISKIACLACIVAEEGPCLIFDDLVRKGVLKIQVPELSDLRTAVSRSGYSHFLAAASKGAKSLRVDPIAIEQCAFRLGAKRPWGAIAQIAH